MEGVSMETVFTAVSDIISTRSGGGGQRQILIGSDSDAVLSAHSGPAQHPTPVLRVHVVQERLLGQAEVVYGGLVTRIEGALPASVADGLGLSRGLWQRRHRGQRGHRAELPQTLPAHLRRQGHRRGAHSQERAQNLSVFIPASGDVYMDQK